MSAAVLVRRPSPRLADGIVTHITPSGPVDANLALRQWTEYVGVFEQRGWRVVQAPPADDCPDGVFIEDQVVVRGRTAVLGRSGAPERRAEGAGLEPALTAAGYRCVAVTSPATLDGGDVLKHGSDIWVGRGARTNALGVQALRAAFGPQRVSVREVPVQGALHLKSAVTLLPDQTALVHDAAHLPTAPWRSVVAVPEPEGVAVVALDGTTVLMSAAAPKTANLLRGKGFHVVTVDISEFEKLEGCVTCLSVRLRG